MSAPSEGAASPPQCACTNISLMQLFHELKQKFPGVPDHVVTSTIATYCHDKSACEVHLQSEVKASLTHAYHASSSAAAKQLSEQKLSDVPFKCRNQSIIKHDFPKANAIKSTPCIEPQTAILSNATNHDFDKEIDSDQRLSDESDEASPQLSLNKTSETKEVELLSPVTINIDNCTSKYCPDSTPSDAESVDVIAQIRDNGRKQDDAKVESQNYKILKSSKVKSNLNEKLEVNKVKPSTGPATEKKVIEKVPVEKQKRPCTLEFIKPNPDFTSFGQTKVEQEPPAASANSIPESKPRSNEGNSTKDVNAEDTKHLSNTGPSSLTQWQDTYPLNLSVNVNCHMDLVPNANRPPRSYGNEGWSDDYSSPRAYTSVNLTVRTPTSTMQSPIREAPTFTNSPGEARGFEGHVTVTVSPSTSRPRPLRRAPPVPHQEPRAIHTPDVEPSTPTDSLVSRQRARLARLARELMVERARLSQLARETAILAAPPPATGSTRKLRAVVQGLRARCHHMARQLDRELTGNEQINNEFYSNIYTGQRHQPAPVTPGAPRSSPPQQVSDEAPSWKCHVCTFENHGLLNKCETCDMPRILVGTDALVNTVDSGIGTLRLSGSRFGSRSVDSGLGSRIDGGPRSNANSRILPV